MRFGELKSIGHNIADSLASGICLMIGHYEVDIFSEALASPEGVIDVDFLTGETSGAFVSAVLAKAVREYSSALEGLCERHGAQKSAFTVLTARFGVDAIYGRHFTVTVEDAKGKRSVDPYYGPSGRKLTKVRPSRASPPAASGR